MADPRKQLESRYLSRRKQILNQIKGDVAFFCSASPKHHSRDIEYPFRQDSNFFYLTGFQETDCVLVLRGNKKPRSILYLKERDLKEEIWVGTRLGLKRARKKFSIDDIRDINDLKQDFKELIYSAHNIYHSLGLNLLLDSLITDTLSSSNNPKFNEPYALKDARLLTSELRLIKDREEIHLCKRASEITARSLKELIPFLKDMKNEKQCALSLESLFAKYGAQGTSFNTIVASGKNATTLHHAPGFSPLWKKELVLIDCGADFQGYAGDITRVFPVSGVFSNEQAEVYDAVKEALEIGIKKSSSGVSLDDIHEAVSKELTRGLVELSVLKGNVSQLHTKGAYKPYFMHRTGHWLGLDVHDISPNLYKGDFCHSYLMPLSQGMLFTIEPGLYFRSDDETVPKSLRGIGIRLEEDILITQKGIEVLSKDIPLDRKTIESLY